MRRGDIDIALLYDFGLGKDIAVQPLAELTPYALLPAGHPLAEAPAVALEALVCEPLILLDLEPSREYFLSLFRDCGLEPRSAIAPSSFEMVRGLVGHGLGYSLLATKPANNMSYDGRALVTRPLSSPVANSRLALATLAGRPFEPQRAEFAGHCRAFFHEVSTVSDAHPHS